MDFNKKSFEKIEGIGFRIKTIRLSRGITVKASHGTEMTSSAYLRSEEGKGSFNNLVHVCEMMKVDVTVDIETATGEKHTVALADYLDFLINHREENFNRSEISTIMNVPYASVIVFETTGRPQVAGMGRYASAMGLKTQFTAVDVHGDPIIPAKRLSPAVISKFEAEFEILTRERHRKMAERIGEDILKERNLQGLSRRKLSEMSGISEARIMTMEKGQASLAASANILNSLGKKFDVLVAGKVVAIPEVPAALDQIRNDRGISFSDFGRTIGATYRTVTTFPRNKNAHLTSIERYAEGLGVKIDYRIKNKKK